MKEKIEKIYFRKTRKLYCRNLIKGINTWAVLLVRYCGPFLKGRREELKQMEQGTRKLTKLHRDLHPRDDVDKLQASRKEGGKVLTSIQDSVDAPIQQLKDYIKTCIGRWILARRNNENNKHQQIKNNQKTKMGRKTTVWTFLGTNKWNLERLQQKNDDIRTNHVKSRIDKTQQNCRCWLWVDRDQTFNHKLREFSKFTLKDYCDITPPDDPHFLNQSKYSWPSKSSRCFSHLWPGVFHILLSTHKIHNREGRKNRRTNKQELWLAPSARREKFVTLLRRLSRVCICAKLTQSY